MKTSIGIIGYGRAGASRLKALKELGVKSVKIATRRPKLLANLVEELESIEVAILSDWRELADDSQLKTVFICSENQAHATQAERLLRASKDVCVEFPLCEDLAEAEALYELAALESRSLHVECIGTLTSRHIQFRQYLTQDQEKAQSLIKVHSQFTGGLYRWVADASANKQWASLSFGRLFQLVDLFGPLNLLSASLLQAAQLDNEEHGYHLQVHLRPKDQFTTIDLFLDERRSQGLRRSHRLDILTKDGPLELTSLERQPLFLIDTAYALSEAGIDHKRPDLIKPDTYADRDKILHTHQLISEIKQSLIAPNKSLKSSQQVH